MEEQKLNEITMYQNETVTQTHVREERTDGSAGQNTEQDLSSDIDIDISQTSEQDEPPSLEDILQFQLNQTQQQLWEMTEERNKFLAKHTACVRRSVILGGERRRAEKQSSILRQQRNVLQARLDALEDQGIDIGKPRNDHEAEARVARRQHREDIRYEGLAGARIFPALSINSGLTPGLVLETELLDATDEMEGEVLVSLLSPKSRQDIDRLFEESDDASSQTSAQVSPTKSSSQIMDEDVVEEAQPPASHQYHNVDVDEYMVYGDENSEDLIDWTPDDEFDLSLYPHTSAQPSFTPVNSAHSNEIEALPSQQIPLISISQSDPAPAQPPLESSNPHHDESLNEPWDSLARPLSPHTLPTASLDSLRILLTPHESDSSERYLEKLGAFEALAQQEYNMTLVNIDEAKALLEQRNAAVMSLESTRGELELSRRDLATRTGERNGARQRIAILEDGLKERETKELQLREELRLEREEDPLADKLFVELSGMRTRCEELEEEAKLFSEVDMQRIAAEQNFAFVRRRLSEAEVVVDEQRARIAELEAHLATMEIDLATVYQQLREANSLRERQHEAISELEQQQIKSERSQAALTAEITQLTAQIAAIRQALEEGMPSEAEPHNTHTQETEIEHLNNQLKDAQEELKALTAELAAAKEELRQSRDNHVNDPTVNSLRSQLVDAREKLMQMQPTIDSQQLMIQNLLAEIEELKLQLERSQGCEEELSQLKAELSATKADLIHCQEQHANDPALTSQATRIDELIIELEEATTSLALAQTQTRNAVAAAEQARDEVMESRRALEATNNMVTQLRQISTENIRELVNLREERDGALHDVNGLVRELHNLMDNADRKSEALRNENQVLSGRFMEAERRAGEYGRQILECEEQVEELKKLVAVLRDGVGRLEDAVPEALAKEEVSPMSPLQPDTPGLFVPNSDSEVGERDEPSKDGDKGSHRVIPAERRSIRRTRNPAPVYVDPESPPDSPTVAPKVGRKRKRGDDEKEQGTRKK